MMLPKLRRKNGLRRKGGGGQPNATNRRNMSATVQHLRGKVWEEGGGARDMRANSKGSAKTGLVSLLLSLERQSLPNNSACVA